MQNAVPIGQGAMAAILNIQVSDLEKFIEKSNFLSIEISNDNCPGQCVISGKKRRIDKFVILIKNELKKKAISLPVSAPFHCKMMKSAAEELQNFLKQFEINDPLIPIISNVSVSPIKKSNEIEQLLISCVYNRVRWREIIEFLNKNNVSECIECGPGKALTNMFKRFEFNIKCVKVDNIEDLKNMHNLKNKKVVITGGSRGIGYAILKEFYENNSDVLTIGSNLQNLENVKKDFPKIKIIQLDLKNNLDLKEKFPKLIEELGGIDILVNNAGITKDNLTLRMKEEDWKDVIDVNLNSVFYLSICY